MKANTHERFGAGLIPLQSNEYPILVKFSPSGGRGEIHRKMDNAPSVALLEITASIVHHQAFGIQRFSVCHAFEYYLAPQSDHERNRLVFENRF